MAKQTPLHVGLKPSSAPSTGPRWLARLDGSASPHGSLIALALGLVDHRGRLVSCRDRSAPTATGAATGATPRRYLLAAPWANNLSTISVRARSPASASRLGPRSLAPWPLGSGCPSWTPARHHRPMPGPQPRRRTAYVGTSADAAKHVQHISALVQSAGQAAYPAKYVRREITLCNALDRVQLGVGKPAHFL